MKIQSIRIKNFRGFKDETVNLDDYTCLVGANGSGKSTVLAALNIFFRHQGGRTSVTNLSRQDFHDLNTNEPISITVTFHQLSAQARDDLSAYVRQGRLVVTARAVWNEDQESAPVEQYGSRLVMAPFAVYFEAAKHGAKAAELKSIYSEIQSSYSELPSVRSMSDMETALRDYEESHPEDCALQESPDQFYGFTKGSNRIGSHCQWVFVPAVKDASEEELESRNSALGELLQRTVRTRVSFGNELRDLQTSAEAKYQELIQARQEVLKSLSNSLESRLHEWAHPGARVSVRWQFDPSKSVQVNEPVAKADVGEGSFMGDLARLGHGLQRSFIVSLLHELAEDESDDAPTLLLGIEEPELYQHPPQARHLAAVLERLSNDAAQVLVTTHSPYFVSGRGFESVRMVRKGSAGVDQSSSRVSRVSHQDLADRLADALGDRPEEASVVMAKVEQILQPSQNELFFSRIPILVEGIEDIAYVTAYLQLTDRWQTFRKLGCHFVVAEGKGKMSRPLAIAKLLGIPVYTVFDGDGHQKKNETDHRRDNGCLLELCGCSGADAFPTSHFCGDSVTMWHETLGRAIRSDIGTDIWQSAENAAKERYGLREGVGSKNTLLISGTLEVLAEQGKLSTVLDDLSSRIISFAEQTIA